MIVCSINLVLIHDCLLRKCVVIIIVLIGKKCVICLKLKECEQILGTICQFLRCCSLGFLIKFKHMIALTNAAQTMLLIRTTKFNTVMCLNLIEEPTIDVMCKNSCRGFFFFLFPMIGSGSYGNLKKSENQDWNL